MHFYSWEVAAFAALLAETGFMHIVLLLLIKVYHLYDIQACSYRESDTQIALVLPHIGQIRNKNVMITSVATLRGKWNLLYVLKFWCHRAPCLDTTVSCLGFRVQLEYASTLRTLKTLLASQSSDDKAYKFLRVLCCYSLLLLKAM